MTEHEKTADDILRDFDTDGNRLVRKHILLSALSRTEAATLRRAAEERDALREALARIRHDINDSPLNRESIVCTVWHGEGETLVDYIDALLSPPDEKRG